MVIAHRSASLGGLPENSLAWVQYAIDRGVDMVHINPQLTGGNQYVLMHDNTLNRTTDVESVYAGGPPGGPTREQRGGRDYVRDYTLEEIKRLQLLDGKDGGMHPVPTLSEVLDLVDGRALVMLGLKTYEIESLMAALEMYKTDNLLFFEILYSDPTVLRDISSATGIGAVISMGGSRDYLADLERLVDGVGSGLTMICAQSRRLTSDFVARLDELGIKLCISGWNGAEDSALVFKDDPDVWLAVLERGYAASTDIPDAVLGLLGR